MKHFILYLFFIICVISGQENGDAVYRQGGWLNGQDHAGIYCSNCMGGGPGIIHITIGGHVDIVSMSDFLAGQSYHYAFSAEGLSALDKQDVVDTALLLAIYYHNDITYTALDMMLDYSTNDTVNPADIYKLRCDGVVEYCYEWNNISVWGISNTGNMYGDPHRFNVSYDVWGDSWSDEHDNLGNGSYVYPWFETSPKVQRGAYGYKWTTFRPTSGVVGDINGDGIVNVSDIVEMLPQFIFPLWSPPYWNMADVNSDYQINVLDIVLIVDMILGGSSSNEYPEETVFINKIVEQRSTPPYVLLVNMINPTVVLGIQMTIQLDPGYKAVEIDSGQYADNTQMTLAYSISPDSTKIKYLFYGPNGEYFPENGSGTILEVGMIYNGSPRSGLNPEGMSVTEMLITNSGTSYLESELIDLIRYEEILNGKYTPNLLPEKYNLGVAYPNPFNPITTLSYDLPKDGQVSLIIYDMIGREVTQLIDTYKDAGYHAVQWDATLYASGTYFVKMTAHNFTQTQKVMLVK